MKKMKFCLYLLSAAFLSACAGPTKVEPVAQVRHPVELRAEARWSAMIAKDFPKAYSFLSPGSKSANTAEQFRQKFRPINWVSARAVSSDCDAEKCRVKVALTITDHRLGGDATTVFEEVWLQDSGQWWLVFN
jgi:hypothetical protein